jgi:hypothetical protein
MGEYFKIINMDKKEFIHPHKADSGIKLWEILANATPLRIMGYLLQYGGRWAGDRVIIEGDYDDKLGLYELCRTKDELPSLNEWRKQNNQEPYKVKDLYTDITEQVLPEYNDFIEIPEYQVGIEPKEVIMK